MKLQKSIIGIGVLLLSLSSCDDFLDRMPDDKKNEVDVFTRYEQVDNLVTDLYARAKFANRPLIFMNHFGSAGLTDECTASSHEQAIPHQSTLEIMDLHKVCQTTVVADNTGGTYIMVSDVPISFWKV